MSHRRDSSSDAVHVIPTNDPPPESRLPNPVAFPVLTTEETESPCKKTRGSPSPSSEIGKAFFKTKLCCNFRAGNCPYVSTTCHFAHSVEELRRAPWQETAAAETRGEVKKFRNGESCRFVHDEASRNRESFAVSLVPNWKTRICNKWEMTGFCPFGTNCNFAHGASELHRFGGGLVEEEGKIRTSSTLDTKKTGQADIVTSLVSPGVSSQRASNAVTQKPNGVRILRKWKGPDKISRVYGDWIDDIE